MVGVSSIARISSLVCTVCMYSKMKYNIVHIENTVQYVQFDMLSTTCMVEFQKNIVNSTVCTVVYVQLVQYCVCSTVRLVLYVKCSTL